MSIEQITAIVNAEMYARECARDLSTKGTNNWHVYSFVDAPEAFVFSEIHPYQMPGHGRVWYATYRNGELSDERTGK